MYYGLFLGFIIGFLFAVAGGTFYYHYAVKKVRARCEIRFNDSQKAKIYADKVRPYSKY